MRFHLGWKSHFGVQSALYLCSHELKRNETQTGMDFISVILTEMKFETGIRFSCEQNLPEVKWINAYSSDIVFSAHVRLTLKLTAGVISLRSFWQKWNFISGDKIWCKHYPKWYSYACPSIYRVVLKCSRNGTSCKQNLFSHRFEVLNRYEFISPVIMWTYSKVCILKPNVILQKRVISKIWKINLFREFI